MTDAFFSQVPSLQINAWTGDGKVRAPPGADRIAWSMSRHSTGRFVDERDRAPPLISDWDWRAPEVGWGLVLPDDPTIQPPARRATASDAPEAIQRIVAARGNAPVLRWRADPGGVGKLVQYTREGRESVLGLASSAGIGPRQVPGFLMIYAPPDRIPWAFQYTANLARYVGRLWLEGDALDRYVDALITDWAGAASDPRAPLVWSVDHGMPDITWLMDQAISRQLAAAWRGDKDGDFVRATELFGNRATHAQLINELVATKPGLVVTTSHGMTGPLKDPRAMAAQLGVPVDVTRKTLDLDALCERWQPDGAIWYAHACCSAGSDTASAYEGLFDPASDVGRVLKGVAACGTGIAPLPQRLLGAQRPLRAFIGHVEPTFDWTLRDPSTGQPLAHRLIDALYGKLFEGAQSRPIGWALAKVFADAGTMLGEWSEAVKAGQRPGAAERALYYQVAALDRQHTVILGDPTAALPALNRTGANI